MLPDSLIVRHGEPFRIWKTTFLFRPRAEKNACAPAHWRMFSAWLTASHYSSVCFGLVSGDPVHTMPADSSLQRLEFERANAVPHWAGFRICPLACPHDPRAQAGDLAHHSAGRPVALHIHLIRMSSGVWHPRLVASTPVFQGIGALFRSENGWLPLYASLRSGRCHRQHPFCIRHSLLLNGNRFSKPHNRLRNSSVRA